MAVKSAQTILSVTGLHIERSGTVIIDDISWRVAAGQHWGHPRRQWFRQDVSFERAHWLSHAHRR